MKLTTAYSRILPSLAAAALSLFCAQSATATTDYPNRALTLIVPFAPGGGTDIQARLVAKGLEKTIGQSVIVVNRPGAAGGIGARSVAASKADGYTLLFGTTSLASESAINENAGFDIMADFIPVSMITNVPFMMVVSCESPIKTTADLVKAAKSAPGKLNYASWGYGSTGNIMGEMFKLATGTDLVHVPYKGESPAAIGLLGGETDMTFLSPVQLPHVKAGKLCPLAITGGKRMAALPDVPTIEETGVQGVDMPMWYGIMVPANTPDEVVHKLKNGLSEAIASEEFVATAASMSLDIVGSTTEEYKQQIINDTKTIVELSKKTRLRE
jgi:tripartite-type tricarboxylate transporter receptor subunit TctC